MLTYEQKIRINHTDITICFGDLFQENGLKVIAFNEYFDTIVDDMIISKNSINGFFIQHYVKDIASLNQNIMDQIQLNKLAIGVNAGRPRGHTINCKLGSIIKYDDYLLVAFSRFTEQNEAYLTISDFDACLLNFWSQLQARYAGYPVCIPLMGSGITRFKHVRNDRIIHIQNTYLTEQELLSKMLQSFSKSNVCFPKEGLRIVLHPNLKNKIDLASLI